MSRRDGGLSSPSRRTRTEIVVEAADGLRWFPTRDHAEAAQLAGEIDAAGEGTAWAVGAPPADDPDGEDLDYDEAVAGMTVEEIVTAVEAGELDRAAVLAAERAGKNRKGVLALDPNA